MSLAVVDFLRAPSQPRVGWVVLVIGVVSLAAVLWQEQQWAAERSEAVRMQQRSQAATQALAKAVMPIKPTLAQHRGIQAQNELQRPWLPVLRAVESAATHPVYLLSLSIDPNTGLVKLEAEAPSFDHALSFVTMLDAGGGLQPATLVSHTEIIVPQAAKPWVKFSVVTQWSVQ